MVATPASIARVLRFDSFELNLHSGELRKGGIKLRLQGQPIQLLGILLQAAGELVTREELRSQLWPADTFVDFDHGLHNSIARIREVLGDSAESPRYIETLPRRGYRFIGSHANLEPESPAATAEPVATPPLIREKYKHYIACLLVAGVITLLVGTRFIPKRSQPAGAASSIRSIAVLPLDNFSGDPSQEYFADGMTDELITDLAKVNALRVISRTSVMRYKGTKKTLPEIARELNVDGIVEGSVTRSGQRVRITAQLIGARFDKHLWAESYERDLGDVIRLQNDVAQAITQQVRAQLTPQQQARFRSSPPVDPKAYEAYLFGRYYLARDAETAKGYLEEAVRKDPRFARAYAGLAEAYFDLGSLRHLAPDRANKLAEDAAQNALKLDDSVGEAHTMLAVLKWRYDWDNPAAEREFASALLLAPNYDCLHSYYASYLAFRGRRAEAMTEITRARELSPSISFDTDEASAEYQLGDYQRLVESSRRGLSLEPNSWFNRYFLGVGYVGLGQPTLALSEFRKAVKLSNGDQDATAALAYAYLIVGKRAEGQKILHDFERQSRRTYVSPYMTATIYAGFGNKEQAFNFLEKAYQERNLDLIWNLKSDPRVNALRSDPRFRDLLHRVGIN